MAHIEYIVDGEMSGTGRLAMAHIEYIVDGEMSGTGLRDALNGGYIEPGSIGLSKAFARDLAAWQAVYEDVHCRGFPPADVARLDQEGLALTLRARSEVPHKHFGYFSAGLIKDLP